MTRAEGSRERPASKTAFWDSSAIVSLCCFQSATSQARTAARGSTRQITWWTTPVEVASAINRLHRERALPNDGRHQALARLDRLRQSWNEIEPTDEVREVAERMLGIHRLRAADALQLAAAMVWCSRRPRGRSFIVADEVLANAADAEGFSVVRLN